ncbi:MAG TPA: hypothetical protein VM619_03395 [Luteimonas sp.]|nr:hypothetical protein [Luteimonas sp.]
MDSIAPRTTATWLPAIVLIAAGVAAAGVMAFHPTAQGMDAEARLHSLAAISPLSMHVHMAMIACVVGVWLAVAYIARSSPPSGWIWLADRLYALGAIAMLGAALVNGFVTGAYLERALPQVTEARDALPSVLLAFSANQALAGFGTLFMSAAIAAWSLALLRMPGRLARACGAYGLCAGAACVVVYAAGRLSLDVAGMTAVVVAHGAWYCLLGIWSLRSGNAEPDAEGPG